MADLDSLQIQISASTTDAKNKIEELIKSFQKLNGALQNYSGESAYVKGLNRLASGLSGIANASNEINPNRIKDIAKSISDLATKGEKLSNLSFVKTFQQMGAESERASLRTRRAVDDIKKTFGITSKEGIESLTKSLNRFYASADDPAALASAEKDIKSLIVEYASLNEELLKTGGTLRKFMSGTNFAIPTGAVKEFGDEYKKMIGVLGVDKQHKDLSKGVGLDVVASEANGVLGTNLDTSSSLAAMESIYNALVQEREEFENLEEAQRKSIATSSELTQYMDRLYESINRVREVSSSISEGGFLTGGGDADLEAIFNGEDLPQIEQTAQQVAANLNEVQKEVIETQELANPFEGIVKGVESLSGLTITAEQFGGIRVLAESLGKLVGSNGEKAGYILPQIASGLAAMSGIQLPDNAAQLQALGQALGSFGSAAATRAQGLPQLVEGLRQLQYVKIPDLNGIRDLAAALSKLGGVKVETAIQNMPRLTEAFTNMIAAISAAPTVSAETVQLAQSMAQLATASRTTGQGTTQASTGISLLRGAVGAALPTFKRAEKHTFSLASAFGKLYASYFLLIRGFRKLGDAIDYSSKLTEVQNVVAHTFGDAASKVDEFADHAIEDFGMAELSAKQFASRFQAMGTTMGISSKQIADANELIYEKIKGNETAYTELGDSMADLSINLTKLTADYASFYNLDYEDVADDMAAIFTGQTRPLRQYGLDLTNATLQEWAMKNGLDANVKSMSQAEKTMLRYQYVMSQSGHIMGDFARTADTWANVVRTIGQQFQKLGRIVGEGLINTFKPLLIRFREFMNTILDLTEKTLNAIGKLLGWQIEIEEVGVAMDDGMEDYADSVGTAADNAKKLNAQLRSIDELNNLTSPNNGDNGGGSDAYGGGGAGENKVSGGLLNVKKYESDIESWFDLGSRIRDKIIEGINSISWDEISQKVKLNAKNFVEFFKGLLFEDKEGNTLGGKIGEFLAESINLGFDWLVTSTGDMSLWGAAGNNIADFFLEFFRNLDVEDMSQTVDNIVQGLKTLITTATDKLSTPENRRMIAEKIGDFFRGIDDETWETAIKGVAIVLGLVTIKNITKWTFSTLIPELFKSALMDKLSGISISPTITAIPKIVIGGTIASYFGLQAGADIGSVFFGEETYEDYQGITGPIKLFRDLKDAIEDVTSGEVEFKWKDFWNQLGEDYRSSAFYENFYDPDIGVFRGVENVLSGDWDKGVETLWRRHFAKTPEWLLPDELKSVKGQQAFIKYYQDTYGTSDLNGKHLSVFGTIGSMFKEMFGPDHTGGGAGHSFGDMGEEQGKEFVDGFDKGVNDNSSSVDFSGIDTQINNWWTTGVATKFSQEEWAALGANISAGLSLGWLEFTNWWQNTGFYDWWTNKVMPWFTREKWATLGENIKKGISDKWNELVTWWQNTALVKWWNENVQPWFTYERWNTLFDNVKRAIKDAFRAGANGAIGYLNNMIGGVETSVNSAIDGLNALIDLAQKIPGVSLILSDVGHIQLPRIQYFADGGFPNPGSLFVAGEAGAEMLGTMNGRTTVASNGEITGISDTIRSTSAEEIALLRQQNQLLQGILQKEFGISNGDIFRSVRTSAMEWKKMTGDPAF